VGVIISLLFVITICEVSVLGFWFGQVLSVSLFQCDWSRQWKTIFGMHLRFFGGEWGFCFCFDLVLSCMPASRSN
jgi:hypothetical protein